MTPFFVSFDKAGNSILLSVCIRFCLGVRCGWGCRSVTATALVADVLDELLFAKLGDAAFDSAQ